MLNITKKEIEKNHNSSTLLDKVGYRLLQVILNYTTDYSSSLIMMKKNLFYTRLMRHPSASGNILFLGEGHGSSSSTPTPPTPTSTTPLAPELRFLGYNIYQTDVFFDEEPVVNGNLIKMKLDHTKAFPFKDIKFDAIIMKRGLCFCNDITQTTSCGGIHRNKESAKSFLIRVIGILNTKNPKSMAVLEGYNNNMGEKNLEFWKDVAKETMDEISNVEVQIILDRTGWDFFALKIVPKKDRGEQSQ